MMDEPEPSTTPDGLFWERFEAFMQKSLLDIKAFSEREDLSYEETKRRVAEWHYRQLFENPCGLVSLEDAQQVRVRQALVEVSQTLESLNRLVGVHSFFLAVNPANEDDKGFLGGTIVGRDFWRCLRGGGDAGARAFRTFCAKPPPPLPTPNPQSSAPVVVAGPRTAPKVTPATAVKNELYTLVRDSLRAISGVRKAEMKWTDHDRLSAYRVRIVGWPDEIPKKNPSSLLSNQNKHLLALAKAGTLRFVRDNNEIRGDATLDGGEQSSEEDHHGLDAAMDEYLWADVEPDIPQTPWSRPYAADAGRSTSIHPQAKAEDDQGIGPRKRARSGES